MAREAVERIDAQRAMGEQMALLPPDPADVVEQGRGRGRDRGNKGLAAWLAAQAYRDPAAVLAEIAGLASASDAITTAMQQAERVCLWAGVSSAQHRLAVFTQLYCAQIRAAEALMAYTHAKRDKPTAPVQAVQVINTVQPSPEGRAPVTLEGRASVRHVPPPMPGEIEQNQGGDK